MTKKVKHTETEYDDQCFTFGNVLEQNKPGLQVKIILGRIYYGLNDIRKAVNNFERLQETLKEAQSYILKLKTFKIKNASDFHIANIMTQALKESEGL